MEYLAPAVALLGVLSAVATYGHRHWADRRADDRKLIAEALSAIAAWKEMPYQVARRSSDAEPEKRRLRDEFHELQRQFAFYQAWLDLVDAHVAREYRALVAAVKTGAAPHIDEAWSLAPDPAAKLGARFAVDSEAPEEAFKVAVRRHLSVSNASRRFLCRLLP